MIDKLRKKIFWIIQISLSVILIGIIVIFASLSYKNTINSSTVFMDRIGRKENKPENNSEAKIDKDPFLINIDGAYRLRIKNNEIIRESNDITDEIRNYAITASNKKSEEGFIGNYIYKIRNFNNNEKEITLMEMKQQ